MSHCSSNQRSRRMFSSVPVAVNFSTCGHTNNTIRQGAIDAMADKFLGWPLPASVQSDTCVTMRPYQFPRYGTSLLNVEEARQMVDYLFASAPNPESKP